MSGLEPLAALGLACNIFQLIEVGRDTIRLAKGIYQSSTPSIDKALEENALVLDNISREVKAARRLTSPSKLEQQLLATADRCSSAARDLEEEVNFLLGNAKRNQLASTLKVVAKTTWRKRRLDRLREGLESAEKLMKTTLLAQIWSRTRATQLDLSNVQDDLRTFILEYKSGSRDIKQLVSDESFRTREHISASSKETLQVIGGIQKTMNTFTLKADIQVDQARRERLLQSLKFPGLNERRNGITEAYEKTFQWIFMGDDGPSQGDLAGSGLENSDWEDSDLEDFDLADPSEASWDLFSNWLSSTAGIYWISGKPGSGKTTLVKYILNHPKTATYLDIWSPRALKISHFFWRPGSQMQQSIKGLLCSLLYQLLDNSAAAINYVFQHVQRQRSGAKDTYTDWSVPELRSIFLQTLASYEHPVFILIDGLDEVHPTDGPLELLDLVEQFPRCRNTKLCLASRPEPILQQLLSAHPHLRLQDLTRADLARYARDHVQLSEAIDEDDFSNSSERSIAPWSPVESIVVKAEGVFLWLVLAVKSINKGFTIGDTTAMIQNRIDHLPGDLTKLYKDMWTRVYEDSPETYRQAAALYFRLLLLDHDFYMPAIFPELTLFRLMLASTSIADQLLDSIENPLNLVTEKVMLQECRKLEKRVESYCFGMIELSQSSRQEEIVGWYGAQYSRVWSRYGQKHLQFIHRTARDFLLDTSEGKEILGHDISSKSSLYSRWFKAHLATSQLYVATGSGPFPPPNHDVVNCVETYVSVLHRKHEIFGPGDPTWTRTIFHLERLCSSGQLLSEGRADRARSCGGVEFLKVAASICCHESIWTAVDIRTLSNVTVSEILLNLCEQADRRIIGEPGDSPIDENGINTLLGEGADPNFRRITLTMKGFHQRYSQVKTPFTAYLERALGVTRDRMDLEYHSIADVLRNLYNFLSRSANLGTMLTVAFLHEHYGNECGSAYTPEGVDRGCGDPGYRPLRNNVMVITNSVLVSFSAHTILQKILNYLGNLEEFEHPRCRQGARYGEIISLIDIIQKRLDNWPKKDHDRIIGRFFDERFDNYPIPRDDSRRRKQVWYVPSRKGPAEVADQLLKELGYALVGYDFRSRSTKCRNISQLVQQMSWDLEADGYDDTWESLAELGILAEVDCELHDRQGWVDKFQKQRSADGSFADGIKVAQSCLEGLNT